MKCDFLFVTLELTGVRLLCHSMKYPQFVLHKIMGNTLPRNLNTMTDQDLDIPPNLIDECSEKRGKGNQTEALLMQEFFQVLFSEKYL
jgi:hypothetical protein